MTRTKATIQSILKSEKWSEKKQNREGRAETSAGDQHSTLGWLRAAVASWTLHQAGRSRPQRKGGHGDLGHEPVGPPAVKRGAEEGRGGGRALGEVPSS